MLISTHRTKIHAALAAALLLAACGSDADKEPPPPPPPDNKTFPQCSASGYLAFDSANHANQDIRVGIYTQLMTWLDEAKGDHTLAQDRFGKAKALYTDADKAANLQEKVQGRTDDHLDGKPPRGKGIDETILAWLDRGAAATTNLEASVAKQWVDKTFTEFFFLSIYHEMLDGSRAHWDEAFGYYGSKSDNAEAELQGFALTAFKRDATNGTNLEAEIFNNLIDGSCALAKALDAAGAEQVDWSADKTLAPIVEDVDLAMQRVLAYSVGHEAFEMQELVASFDIDNAEHTDTFWIKLAELEPFFIPLEALMTAKGGESKQRAEEIRALIAPADFADLTNTTWMTEFVAGQGGTSGPARIIELLEREFEIEIKG